MDEPVEDPYSKGQQGRTVYMDHGESKDTPHHVLPMTQCSIRVVCMAAVELSGNVGSSANTPSAWKH